MPRPGTDIYILDGTPPGGPSLDTGQAFFVGVAERGSTSQATLVQSFKAFQDAFGARSGGSLLTDAANAFFSEGGRSLYVARAAGTGNKAATGTLTPLTVTAVSPGTWGNQVKVSMNAAAPWVATVEYPVGTVVERSSIVATSDDLYAWSLKSNYVRITGAVGAALPAANATVTLTTGANGSAPVAADVITALGLFPMALGPGQVAAPGYTANDVQSAVMAHCDATKRVALLDMIDTSDYTALVAQAAALYGKTGARMAALFGPWAQYPGPASPSTITIPYSGVQAGLIARADALGNPNQPAAGVNGISRVATGLSQSYTDANRETVNAAGGTLAKVVYGDVRTYGGRTVAGPSDTNWLWFGNSRVVMAIAHEAAAIAENYVLQQIDGRNQLFARLEAALSGMLLGYYNAGALFGETPQDAFYVDTSEAVNTIATIAAGEVHAAIYVKCSPSAEYVRIDIVKVPVERGLPAAIAA